jgi:hypothetical protein
MQYAVRDIMAGLTIVFVAPFPVGEAHPRATWTDGPLLPSVGRTTTATRRPPHDPRGTRPATARTFRGEASQIAAADTTLAPIESQNAST